MERVAEHKTKKTGLFAKYIDLLNQTDTIHQVGTVNRVVGSLIESDGPGCMIGEQCQINGAARDVDAEVVGFNGSRVQLMSFSGMEGLAPGIDVVGSGRELCIKASQKLLGRVLDGLGRPIDGGPPINDFFLRSVAAKPPALLGRRPLTERLTTGVRAIDFFTPLAKGQRVGIFAGSGVGKSNLLAMIARNSLSQVNVLALIGERGREVQEFISNVLKQEGLARSVVIASTSDQPPLLRMRAAYVATAIAEYFRDQGNDVTFLFDSITRFARAQREIGLAVGEPAANRGFPPSVWEKLPQLLERCCSSPHGTITGLYTILVEGDDPDEPVADNVRGILDGHINLSRRLAERGHYPAIDVSRSLSRLAAKITDDDEQQAVSYLRRLIAAHNESEDLINVGAYVNGSNTLIDSAIEKNERVNLFLQQKESETAQLGDTLQMAADLSETTIERAAAETSTLRNTTEASAQSKPIVGASAVMGDSR